MKTQEWKRKVQYREEKRQQRVALFVHGRLAGVDQETLKQTMRSHRSLWSLRCLVEELERKQAEFTNS